MLDHADTDSLKVYAISASGKPVDVQNARLCRISSGGESAVGRKTLPPVVAILWCRRSDRVRTELYRGALFEGKMRFTARVDDLKSIEVQELVFEHLRGMHASSPPGHVNAFAIEALQKPEVTFWSIWDGPVLCGCAAMKELSPHAGEIKSMRTRASHLRQGVGQYALDMITQTAKERGYQQLLLETGTGEAFEAAHKLYLKNGFTRSEAFGDYRATHFNIFMTKDLLAQRGVA